MRPLVCEVETQNTPESLAAQLRASRSGREAAELQLVVLRSGRFDAAQARYSFVTAFPFLTFRSFGSRCELTAPQSHVVQFGNPWHLLDGLMSRYELLDEIDLPFPLGGCFGYWGYDLKNFVESRLPRRAVNDLELPDCHVGFYDSLVVFDHQLGKSWIISTGLQADGSRNEQKAQERLQFWQTQLFQLARDDFRVVPNSFRGTALRRSPAEQTAHIRSNLSRELFLAKVQSAQEYIRSGDIYQVNLSHRLSADWPLDGWSFFENLSSISPAPFSAYLDCADFEIASSSPESFLRMSGSHIQTRPIKGTRPRSADPIRDAQLTYELQTSAKEMAELVMITDLLRNDLGRVCEYGSVQVPELVRLERYPHVQHLVSTVEGRLRRGTTHFAAFSSCFPGGSITGAPKIRAMEIIDELEPISRGPYTGAIGYLGFNRESQLNIAIRTAVCKDAHAHFHVGAGIVADSLPQAEYEETLAKGRGFLEALGIQNSAMECGSVAPDSNIPALRNSTPIL